MSITALSARTGSSSADSLPAISADQHAVPAASKKATDKPEALCDSKQASVASARLPKRQNKRSGNPQGERLADDSSTVARAIACVKTIVANCRWRIDPLIDVDDSGNPRKAICPSVLAEVPGQGTVTQD